MLITPSGDLYFNANQANADWLRLTQIAAADGAQIRRVVDSLSGLDGGVVPGGYYDPLYPSFAGNVIPNVANLATKRIQGDKLRAYLRSLLRADGTWRWLPSGANIVTNGGFEVDTTGWAASGSGAAIARSTAQHNDGAASLQITTGTTNDTGAIWNRTTGTVIPNVQYVASLYCKRTSGSGNLTLRVITYNAAGSVLTTDNQTFSPGASFGQVTNTFISDPTADSFELYVLNEAGVAQTVFIDQVKVEASRDTSVTAYIEPGTFGYRTLLQRTVRLHMAPEITQADRMDNFQFALVAADPNAYSYVQHTSPDIAINGSSQALINAGDTTTYPILRIYGAVTNPVITNVTQSLSITFTGGIVIANGDYVELDTRTGRATLNSTGASVLSSISYATWPTFDAGSNTWQATGTSPSGAMKLVVLWRDAFSG